MPFDHPQHADALQELLAQGVLAEYSDAEIASSTAVIDAPEIALIDGYVDIETEIKWRDVANFVLSWMTAKSLLRWRSLEHVIDRIRRRKNTTRSYETDLEVLRNHTAVFTKLSPLIYTTNKKCLLSSLAAYEYLSRCGFSTQLVFGVTTTPFKAHCWLQYRNIVVNDTPEHVSNYTPILSA